MSFSAWRAFSLRWYFRSTGTGSLPAAAIFGHGLLEAILQPWLRWWFSSPQDRIWCFCPLLYGIAAVAVLFVRIYVRERVRFRQVEAEKLRALDHARSQFFSNISHEFRTPLTVILGMADQIREAPSRHVAEKAVLIRRNGKKLLRLVYQLLDLSRLEAGALSVHYVQSDVVLELKYLLESFHSLAEAKNIRLHFSSASEEIWMDFDPEKLEHLVGNLLDNAIKYTPAGVKCGLSWNACRHRPPT
ncbi:MAG: HAMP domain-containing histidine kinase [Lewinellaceae bacterium]|nr:HAMP domain-containing histidine kinase [Lewinellaceae bacterium]